MTTEEESAAVDEERARFTREFKAQFRREEIRRLLLSPSGFFTVLRGVMPLVGITLLHWSALETLAFYFVETIAIGLFNIPRILLARGAEGPGNKTSRGFNVFFFCIHYGFFVGIQAFMMNMSAELGGGETIVSAFFRLPGVWAGVGSILVNEVISFVRVYSQPGARERLSSSAQLFQPYGRIFVQQFVVILGGWGAMVLRGNAAVTGFLVVLVAARLFADLFFASFFDRALETMKTT